MSTFPVFYGSAVVIPTIYTRPASGLGVIPNASTYVDKMTAPTTFTIPVSVMTPGNTFRLVCDTPLATSTAFTVTGASIVTPSGVTTATTWTGSKGQGITLVCGDPVTLYCVGSSGGSFS